ncbi:sel1 repeat family protein [Paracoccus zhejiangensis]|uniref:Sel1 repeat family protein n=2 Tax=Paracoccus zhejiangensis TaxID=1077935 RepID=A0A2H5EUE5_9RHOB|nr:sel1 repeat family protein [Paracoccus zhejiangensis]
MNKHAKINFNIITCVIICFLIPFKLYAQDYYTGREAHSQGRYADALREWLPLALAGNAEAQNDVGFMYAIGQGVTQDHVQAVHWFRLAALQGHPSAQYALGSMYEGGEGLQRDIVKAYMWLHISSVNPNQSSAIAAHSAEQVRDIIANSMTADEVADALLRSRACLDSSYRECD